MIAAKTSRSPARRRPPPCERFTSVGGTTHRNQHSFLQGPPGRKPPVLPVAAIDDPALPEALAEPAAARADEMDGWTLHRLRHSALTHDAEGGTSTPMLLARSRHASVPWNGTPARASTRSPGTSRSAIPLPVAGTEPGTLAVRARKPSAERRHFPS